MDKEKLLENRISSVVRSDTSLVSRLQEEREKRKNRIESVRQMLRKKIQENLKKQSLVEQFPSDAFPDDFVPEEEYENDKLAALARKIERILNRRLGEDFVAYQYGRRIPGTFSLVIVDLEEEKAYEVTLKDIPLESLEELEELELRGRAAVEQPPEELIADLGDEDEEVGVEDFEDEDDLDLDALIDEYDIEEE